MRRQSRGVMVGVALCAAVGGCQSAGEPVVREPVLIGGLVIPNGQIGPDGWEFTRNDPLMNHRPSSVAFEFEWSEIRTRDRLRTDNGRPREYSTTSVRTIQRRLSD